MKINFDWHNFMSKNDTNKTSQIIDNTPTSGKDVKGAESIHNRTIIDISDKVTDDFTYLDQGLVAEKLTGGMNSEDCVALKRDFMTVMSNSMSASDFQKMQEDGYDVTRSVKRNFYGFITLVVVLGLLSMYVHYAFYIVGTVVYLLLMYFKLLKIKKREHAYFVSQSK